MAKRKILELELDRGSPTGTVSSSMNSTKALTKYEIVENEKRCPPKMQPFFEKKCNF